MGPSVSYKRVKEPKKKALSDIEAHHPGPWHKHTRVQERRGNEALEDTASRVDFRPAPAGMLDEAHATAVLTSGAWTTDALALDFGQRGGGTESSP